MKYPTSFQSKKYPEFIRESIILKAFPKPTKIFPKIGLPNCSEELSDIEVDKLFIFKKWLEKMCSSLSQLHSKFFIDYHNPTTALAQSAIAIRRDLNALINYISINDHTTTIINNNGVYGLKLPVGHFPMLNIDQGFAGIASVLAEHNITHTFPTFDNNKKVSAQDLCPFKNTKLKLYFSSDGNQGFWDLATMSMRGISSCMRWAHYNSKALVGTIVDPYVGMIYLSDDKKFKHGSKMFARALVRLVVKGDRPCLFIERLYFASGISEDIKNNISEIFVSWLKLKVPEVDVVYLTRNQIARGDGLKYSIPYTDITDKIDELAGEDDCSPFASYKDSNIVYKYISRFYNPNKIKLIAKKKTRKVKAK